MPTKAEMRSVYINNGTGWVNDSSWQFPLDLVDSDDSDQGVRMIDLNADSRVDVIRARDGYSEKIYLNNGSGWESSVMTDQGVYFSGTLPIYPYGTTVDYFIYAIDRVGNYAVDDNSGAESYQRAI